LILNVIFINLLEKKGKGSFTFDFILKSTFYNIRKTMIKTKEKVTFSGHTWDELYKIDYYQEVSEAIENREALRKSK
jgi:hypothetical protein